VKKSTKCISLLSMAMLLSACGALQSENEENTRSAEMLHSTSATQFDRFLSEGYRRLARREDREHDFADSDLYLQRGEKASSGRLVTPYTFEERQIPEYAVEELTEARARLDDAFYRGASVKMPQESATAQVMFDCWMEQQEEDIQPHHIEECKSRFEEAMLLIEAKLGVKGQGANVVCEPAKPAPQPVAAPIPKEEPVIADKGPYIVYFDLKSYSLRPDALSVIQEAARTVEQIKPKRVVLTGHTDTSGTRAYNNELSRNRVQSVMEALRLAGVSIEVIDESHYGESVQRVATGDGVRKAENRRVEIGFDK